ncbi:hypothetical protein PH547_28055 [Rhizobium sp. CNPSo 3464]|uniref:hypothetical protein n=1 Tax=Rhizobium sp. CNPSo 3464 TaxID=3021406 RepID=UPI00254A6E68|nr:hypothetical protein [Rhizobium sp. CNPSo 3464]MDK4742749.1 hypothetical protein [Rhizobium sp. CNPSo 3464]
MTATCGYRPFTLPKILGENSSWNGRAFQPASSKSWCGILTKGKAHVRYDLENWISSQGMAPHPSHHCFVQKSHSLPILKSTDCAASADPVAN